jgi:hypothetical protein
MKKYFIISALLSFQSLFSLSLTGMTEEEQKSCGILQLNAEQKQSLDAWLQKQVAPPQPPVRIEKHKIVHGEFLIIENVNLGRFITLDNGVTYDIPSRTRKKTMSWKVGDKVQVVEPIHPTNYKLENKNGKQTIGAKIAKSKVKE